MAKKSAVAEIVQSPAEQLLAMVEGKEAADQAGREAWREGESALVAKADNAATQLEATLRECEQDPLGVLKLLKRKPFYAPQLGRSNSSFGRLDTALDRYTNFSRVVRQLRDVRSHVATIDYQMDPTLRLGTKGAAMTKLTELVDVWCITAATSKDDIMKPIRHCLDMVQAHLERTKP